jgi:hypothetical protein
VALVTRVFQGPATRDHSHLFPFCLSSSTTLFLPQTDFTVVFLEALNPGLSTRITEIG